MNDKYKITSAKLTNYKAKYDPENKLTYLLDLEYEINGNPYKIQTEQQWTKYIKNNPVIGKEYRITYDTSSPETIRYIKEKVNIKFITIIFIIFFFIVPNFFRILSIIMPFIDIKILYTILFIIIILIEINKKNKFNQKYNNPNYEKTEAEEIDYIQHYDTESSTFYPILKYYANGEEQYCINNKNQYRRIPKNKKTYNIKYNINNPKEVVLPQDDSSTKNIIIVIAIYILLIIEYIYFKSII